MRSGFIYNNGYFKNASYSGYDRSSSATSDVWSEADLGAYFLVFYNISVHPSRGPDSRWLGHSLRYLTQQDKASGEGSQVAESLDHLMN